MVWNDAYSVGVAQIDAQHKHLVGMINGLIEVMSRGSRPDELQALLDDLMTYARSHFDFEERLMARAAYAGLATHREKHAAMKAEVERLTAGATGTSAVIPIKLMTFLKNWLIKHINGTDKDYIPAMQKAGLA